MPFFIPGEEASSGGGRSGGGTTRQLAVSRATAAGVDEGAAQDWPSSTLAWSVAVAPTATAPRVKLTLPTGLTLSEVIDSLDGAISFVRVGATQVWLSDPNRNLAGVARVLLVRTEE